MKTFVCSNSAIDASIVEELSIVSVHKVEFISYDCTEAPEWPWTREDLLEVAKKRLEFVIETNRDGAMWISCASGIVPYIKNSKTHVYQICVGVKEGATAEPIFKWSEAIVLSKSIAEKIKGHDLRYNHMNEFSDGMEIYGVNNPIRAEISNDRRKALLQSALRGYKGIGNGKELVRQNIGIFEDFPKPGITFYDILPIFRNAVSFHTMIDLLILEVKQNLLSEIDLKSEEKSDLVFIGLESRGFLLAPILAREMKASTGVIRKKGKLPGKTIDQIYSKEYGDDVFEISHDSLSQRSKVILVDDLVATGGTLIAAEKLCQKLNARVLGAISIIDLKDLHGPFTFPTASIFQF